MKQGDLQLLLVFISGTSEPADAVLNDQHDCRTKRPLDRNRGGCDIFRIMRHELCHRSKAETVTAQGSRQHRNQVNPKIALQLTSIKLLLFCAYSSL